MKKLVLSLSVLLCSLAAIAQDYPGNNEQGLKPMGDKSRSRRREGPCSKVFLDLSTGLNNNGGLLGVGMDIHVADQVSINGGIGLLSTWGYKFYAGGKYFFKPSHTGWAIGGGLTYNTGRADVNMDLETIYLNKQTVVITMEPQLNFYASAYKYWSVGRKSNRMFLQLGLSAPLTQHKYTQLAGAPISKDSGDALRLISPGGLIVGLGFSFGLHSSGR